MHIAPSNTAFVDAVRQACKALDRTTLPTRSVAVLPEAEGKFSLKLVDITPHDSRNIVVLSETIAENADDVKKALGKVFLSGNVGDELVFLNEKLDQPNVSAHRWILLNPITMKGAEIGGRIPSSGYNQLITS